jgi:hypothetical protein
MNRSIFKHRQTLVLFLTILSHLPLYQELILLHLGIHMVCLILDIHKLSLQCQLGVILHHMDTHLGPILVDYRFHPLINLIKTN